MNVARSHFFRLILNIYIAKVRQVHNYIKMVGGRLDEDNNFDKNSPSELVKLFLPNTCVMQIPAHDFDAKVFKK